MKSCNTHTLLFVITILSLFACNPQREASDLLRQAQKLVDTQPDVALQLIDSIFYPEQSLSEREYMSYLVTRVQVRDRNHLSIDADTLIFVARDFFAERNNDLRQTTLAFFYSGLVYHQQGNFDEAVVHYKQAAKYAPQIDDVNLRGLIHFNIGDLLTRGGLHLKALEEYKKAKIFFAKSPLGNAMEQQTHCLAAIGRMYMLSRRQDSAFAAFYKGLELAKRSENQELLSLLSQNIFVSYFQAGKYEKAEKHLRQSFELNNDAANLPHYYLNFARLFMNTNQTDSLNLYVDKLRQAVEQSDDLYLKVAVYDFLATEAKTRHDFDAAFEYLQKDLVLVEKIHQKRLEQSVYEVRRKFDYQRYQEAHMQALLQRQRQIIALLASLLAISLLAISMYRKVLHQKNRMLSLQNAFDTLKQTIRDLQQNQQIAGEKQAELNKVLEWKFELLRKSLLLQSDLKRINIIGHEKVQTKFTDMVVGRYADSYHKAFAEITEILYPGLSAFIKQQYPKFTETDHNVALFLLAGLSVTDIHVVLNKSENTINKAFTHIRQKMNLPKRADFHTVLKEMYHESIKF